MLLDLCRIFLAPLQFLQGRNVRIIILEAVLYNNYIEKREISVLEEMRSAKKECFVDHGKEWAVSGSNRGRGTDT